MDPYVIIRRMDETNPSESPNLYASNPNQPSQSPDMDWAESSVTFRRSHLYAVLIPLAFVLGLSVGFLFWGRDPGATVVARSTSSGENAGPAVADNSAETSKGQPAPAAQEERNTDQGSSANQGQDSQNAPSERTEIQRYDIPTDDDPQLGPADAPITIVEFSDYECPYCRKFHIEVFKRLIDEYQEEVRFVYRDFPLASIHSNAIAAAEASNCADEQGVYWDYHDRLFSMEQGLSRDAYLAYAQDLSLDLAAFTECIDSRRYEDEVQADYDFAARLGVRSTPTFFINGLPVVGAQPFEVFQQVIEKELAGEIP